MPGRNTLTVLDGARVCTHLRPCVFVRLCVYPRAYDETWQRRLECSLGTRESPTRPAPLPLPKAFLQEETEAEGKLAATRKELVGIPLTRLLSSRLYTGSPCLLSSFFFLSDPPPFSPPSFHRIISNIPMHAVPTFKLPRWHSQPFTVTVCWYLRARFSSPRYYSTRPCRKFYDNVSPLLLSVRTLEGSSAMPLFGQTWRAIKGDHARRRSSSTFSNLPSVGRSEKPLCPPMVERSERKRLGDCQIRFSPMKTVKDGFVLL